MVWVLKHYRRFGGSVLPASVDSPGTYVATDSTSSIRRHNPEVRTKALDI